MIKLEITGEHVAAGVVLAIIVFIVTNITSCVNKDADIAREINAEKLTKQREAK